MLACPIFFHPNTFSILFALAKRFIPSSFITIERLSSRFEPKLQEAVSYSEKDGTDLQLD